MTPPPDPDSSLSPARSPLSTPAVRATSDPSGGRRPSSPHPKVARPEMRGAGCRLVAGFPRAPPWCRRARRRTEPGDPAPGLPGRPTRCARNPGEGRDSDARPGGCWGSRPRLRELHRGAPAAYLRRPAPGPGEIAVPPPPRPACPRAALGVAAGPPAFARSSRGPQAEWGSSLVSAGRPPPSPRRRHAPPALTAHARTCGRVSRGPARLAPSGGTPGIRGF